MACQLHRTPTEVFLDFSDSNSDHERALLEALGKRFAGSKIVVAGIPSNSQLVVQLVKMGAHDFVAFPINLGEVRAVFSQTETNARSAQSQEPEHKNITITVLGPKGGSGVTLLTANLAVALAKQHPNQVIACDLSAQCGDLATYLDLSPTYNIRHWLDRYGQIDETYMDGLILKHDLGAHVLAGPSMDQEPLGSKHLRELQSILMALKQKYKFLLIDSGTVDPGLLQQCLTHSDIILLVGCLDIPSLKGLTNIYQNLVKLDFMPEQIRIAVNRFNSKNQISINAFEKNINHPIACFLPNNYPLCSESVNTGKPLIELDAKSELVKKIGELAASVQNPEAATVTKPQERHATESLANKMARFLVHKSKT